MTHKTSRNRQRQVECAAEHYLRSIGCVNTTRAVKTRFQRQDLLACDAIGKRASNGTLVGIQVTCGDRRAVCQRRRKLEAVKWSVFDTVLLGEYREERQGRKMRRWFRMHELLRDGWQVWSEPVEIPPEWFKAWKPNKGATP